MKLTLQQNTTVGRAVTCAPLVGSRASTGAHGATRPTRVAHLALALVSAFIFQPLALFGQGSLTPPGAPAPTMKTLAQVEPRTPVSALPCAITNAGSYYLTTNLIGVSGASGITITASNVTLDLNGFALIGVPGSVHGIQVASGATGLCVHNGVIRRWGSRGVDAEGSDGAVFEDLRVLDNGSWGLASGQRSVVRNCTAIKNRGRGIAVDYHSVVTGCLAAETDGDGFFSPNGVTMRDCLAMNNAGNGFTPAGVSVLTGCTSRDNWGAGFWVGDGSSVVNCTATANGGPGVWAGLSTVVKDCSLKNNGNGGVVAQDNCTIRNCVVRQNAGPGGIEVQSACLVLDNTCFEHGDEGNHVPGIRVRGGGNRIEANNVCSNRVGIVVEGTGNFVFRNTAIGNTFGNYTNAPGNVVGQILNVTGGATVTNANPWANFSY
ncbi:MAG: right-handed parallel beta-helix repeat-containing protein [Verrucomicrobiae bacterium]|nr:right-handed parallel beta-helix repeat-containing protein [Verrucomicrobiae bacterium]